MDRNVCCRNIILIFILCFCMSTVHCKSEPISADRLEELRMEMVERQLKGRGITDERVLEAFRKVPRHLFVPHERRGYAYNDTPIPIGKGQTISQPYMVALMTELVVPKEGKKILEIGTGSGYQAAILAEIVGQKNVFTIEIIDVLAQQAKENLRVAHYADVKTKQGDGYKGWPEFAPFDGIIITAAVEQIPQPLIEQLAENGKLIVPVDNELGYQTLKVLTKVKGKINTTDSIGCRFVPFLGEHGKQKLPD